MAKARVREEQEVGNRLRELAKSKGGSKHAARKSTCACHLVTNEAAGGESPASTQTKGGRLHLPSHDERSGRRRKPASTQSKGGGPPGMKTRTRSLDLDRAFARLIGRSGSCRSTKGDSKSDLNFMKCRLIESLSSGRKTDRNHNARCLKIENQIANENDQRHAPKRGM